MTQEEAEIKKIHVAKIKIEHRTKISTSKMTPNTMHVLSTVVRSRGRAEGFSMALPTVLLFVTVP